MQTEILTEKIIEALEDTKGKHIVKMDLSKIYNSFCKMFVICHGTSTTHVSALANNVDDKIRKELHEHPLHMEGYNNSSWVVIDYGDVVVHIFIEDERDRYRLEELWADAKMTEFKDIL